MESNFSIEIRKNLFAVEKNNLASLYQIRHWENLLVAESEDIIWIKDFTDEQIVSVELKKIQPSVLYIVKENLLFEKDHLVPSRKIPSGLFWDRLYRKLPIQLPEVKQPNPYIDTVLDVELKKDSLPKDAFAILVDKEILKKELNTGGSLRLKNLQWIVLNDSALVFGLPILPIPGVTFYKDYNHLIPFGYQHQNNSISKILDQKLNPNQQFYILWNHENQYELIEKSKLKTLSRSSINKTIL